jgi:hypothetical protein
MNAPDEKKAFSFDWGTGSAGGEKSDVMGTTESGLAHSPVGAADKEATEQIETARRSKRGRKSREEIEAEARRVREEFAKEYEKLFDASVWGGICRSPADLMLHLTKRDLWRIEERELEPLAVGASNTARLFLRTDPKWVALTMFLISLSQIYGARIAIHVAQVRKEKTERGKHESVPA